nr:MULTISPECIES: hypothetical protein [unclassified Caballeronia]
MPTWTVAAAALGACISPPSFALATASAGSAGACTERDPTRTDLADVTCTVLGEAAFAKRTTRRAAVIATYVDESSLAYNGRATCESDVALSVVMPRTEIKAPPEELKAPRQPVPFNRPKAKVRTTLPTGVDAVRTCEALARRNVALVEANTFQNH